MLWTRESACDACVNAAIRLDEIYRTVKKEPDKARRAVEKVRERYPEASEWERYDEAVGGDCEP